MDGFDRQVAIIVPVYNAGNKIKKCICSILRQSVENFSLVLVNDGSTDESGKICDEYARKDRRISVIHQKKQRECRSEKIGDFF